MSWDSLEVEGRRRFTATVPYLHLFGELLHYTTELLVQFGDQAYTPQEREYMRRFLIVIAVLALLIPGALLAQGELTLEGLAEQLAALMGRVDAVEQRVTALESEPETGYCSPSVKNYHPMTIAGIAEEHPDHEINSYPDISFVRLNTETGSISVQWQSCCTEIVTEHYNNRCEWEGFDIQVD